MHPLHTYWEHFSYSIKAPDIHDIWPTDSMPKSFQLDHDHTAAISAMRGKTKIHPPKPIDKWCKHYDQAANSNGEPNARFYGEIVPQHHLYYLRHCIENKPPPDGFEYIESDALKCWVPYLRAINETWISPILFVLWTQGYILQGFLEISFTSIDRSSFPQPIEDTLEVKEVLALDSRN